MNLNCSEFNFPSNCKLNPNSQPFTKYNLNTLICSPDFNNLPKCKLYPCSSGLNHSPKCKVSPYGPEFNHLQQYQFNPAGSEVDHSPQHNSYHNNSKYNSPSVDKDNASILSLDSLSDCEYLDAESYDYDRTVFEEENGIESIGKNVPADHKENTLISHANSAPLKASPLVDGKLKRNCALQSMFDRYAQGETQFNNIEVNRECFANLAVAQSPVIISKPSEAIDQVIEISEGSSQNSYHSNQSVDTENSSVVPSEPLQDVAGCLNRSLNKNMDSTLDPKSKVVAWLCADDSQILATQQLNIVPPPKPKPINLCDDAFAFKVKTTNVVKGKASVVCTKNIAVQTKTNVQQEHEEKETDKPQPKGKLSVEEIYNKLKANQGKPSATASAPKTYENFVKVENSVQSSSNTVWDNIQDAMTKKSLKKPKKWQKLM